MRVLRPLLLLASLSALPTGAIAQICAAQPLSWTDGPATCQGTLPATENGAYAVVHDARTGLSSGAAIRQCQNGSWSGFQSLSPTSGFDLTPFQDIVPAQALTRDYCTPARDEQGATVDAKPGRICANCIRQFTLSAPGVACSATQTRLLTALPDTLGTAGPATTQREPTGARKLTSSQFENTYDQAKYSTYLLNGDGYGVDQVFSGHVGTQGSTCVFHSRETSQLSDDTLRAGDHALRLSGRGVLQAIEQTSASNPASKVYLLRVVMGLDMQMGPMFNTESPSTGLQTRTLELDLLGVDAPTTIGRPYLTNASAPKTRDLIVPPEINAKYELDLLARSLSALKAGPVTLNAVGYDLLGARHAASATRGTITSPPSPAAGSGYAAELGTATGGVRTLLQADARRLAPRHPAHLRYNRKTQRVLALDGGRLFMFSPEAERFEPWEAAGLTHPKLQAAQDSPDANAVVSYIRVLRKRN
jgi:hypothetical protein